MGAEMVGPIVLHTLTRYEVLISEFCNAGYSVSTASNAAATKLFTPFLILRHDVEWSARRAMAMAKIEEDLGIRSTFYFRADTSAFHIPTMQSLQKRGFDIGYHYNVLDRAEGNFVGARNMFIDDLNRFRDNGLTITSCAPHGDPRRNSKLYTYNWELFKQFPTLLGDSNLLDLGPWGMLFGSQGKYERISDANMRWNRGAMAYEQIVQSIQANTFPSVFMLIHSDYWSASRFRAMCLHSAAAATRLFHLRSSAGRWSALRPSGSG